MTWRSSTDWWMRVTSPVKRSGGSRKGSLSGSPAPGVVRGADPSGHDRLLFERGWSSSTLRPARGERLVPPLRRVPRARLAERLAARAPAERSADLRGDSCASSRCAALMHARRTSASSMVMQSITFSHWARRSSGTSSHPVCPHAERLAEAAIRNPRALSGERGGPALRKEESPPARVSGQAWTWHRSSVLDENAPPVRRGQPTPAVQATGGGSSLKAASTARPA